MHPDAIETPAHPGFDILSIAMVPAPREDAGKAIAMIRNIPAHPSVIGWRWTVLEE